MNATKIVNLMRGGLDGLRVYTTEELAPDKALWVPNAHLSDLLSGKSFSEILDVLDDPDNERYLDYDTHLIAYMMAHRLPPEEGCEAYIYIEDPAATHRRIMSRETIDQEHQ